MTISYKWLSEYLPVSVDPERLSKILTSVGLEVESLSVFEEIRGGLKGLLIGEVLETQPHPNADKLTLTKVNIGGVEPLNIVCGAPNVAAGQKVVVAPVGSTIYPSSGEPMTMKMAKIRGVESQGMICAEDEIGLGTSHAGILVLPPQAEPGTLASNFFKPYEDWVYEIGLTPNRMDAMSHWGVAKDVCAYLSHHDKSLIRAKLPNGNGFKPDNLSLPITVRLENAAACPRYSGISLSQVKVGESPKWLQQKLKAIGLRPINNIVDITNFIQHETGQPLHAFDADKIAGRTLIVKNLPEGTPFVTLDEKERKLSAEDLMICDENEGLCIAGVFGGMGSGVTTETQHLFIESAFFDPITIRKTSFRHGLRTDAASRFEKGTDISATVAVLKRAASLIKEIAGGEISSDIIDIYPDPREKTEVAIKYHFLKKLSGKSYHPDTVKDILTSLGFEIAKEGIDELRVYVPFSKPDISLPADIVEEILRIDGLDNIDIPSSITITPSVEERYLQDIYKEKTASYLAGAGFSEIITNSITNAAYFSEAESEHLVKMLNSLSADLNVLRLSLLETALECVAHNLNHRNSSLQLFEFGRAYSTEGPGKYQETDQLCLVLTGDTREASWQQPARITDSYQLKGAVLAVLQQLGIEPETIEGLEVPKLTDHIVYKVQNQVIAGSGQVKNSVLSQFGIKQPVYFAALNWELVSQLAADQKIAIKPIVKFPAVQRDLAAIVSRQLAYAQIESTIRKIKLSKLQDMKLFDIFESEKLGKDRRSLAMSFTFQDEEKTLTDKEIDGWMNKIMSTLEKELQVEIRK